MSKIQIVGPLTGTGTLTLTSDVVNTDQTITFPNTTATIVAVTPGTAGNVITSNGTAWVSQAASTPVEIITPTNTSPANGATGQIGTPTLTASTFYSLYGFSHTASQWQVSTSSGFVTTVVNTGDVANLTSYTISFGILSTSTTYYWRVRYKDSNGSYSSYSTPTTFTTAASFNYTIDYLVVAGGGGGGRNDGASTLWGCGGGGAGGYRNFTSQTLTPGTVYTATIGSGGASTTKGNNSTFSTNSSTGGGQGALRTVGTGSAGGSAGGGSVAGNGGTGNQGGYTPSEGNNGGNGFTSGDNNGGGGGGGAGAAGANGTPSVGGNGGVGVSNSITGSAVFYAGGGGGGGNAASAGSGGNGGGGNGSASGSGANGTANTGGGGGGAAGGSSGYSGGTGGSGVVILRMLTANYSGTTTGSPTVTTDGLYTVVKFTGTGTYTA